MEIKTKKLLDDMIIVALSKVELFQTISFSNVKLDPKKVRWGCRCILKWLRVQSISLKVKPLELNLSSEFDKACYELIEQSQELREIFVIEGDCLKFLDCITYELAIEIMQFAREQFTPPLRH